MRINDVVFQTGLTKKAIYYYIREGLLSPASESKNGYMIFTESDVAALRSIRKLRSLDFSVEDIRNILQFPSTASYYFVRKIKELHRQKNLMEWQESFLKNILDSIHMESSREELFAELNSAAAFQPDGPGEEAVDLTDARLMAVYFWGIFMRGLEMTEYRRFLWNRLANYIVAHQNPDLIAFRNRLYSLSAAEAQEVFSERNRLIEQVASLTEADYGTFIEQMLAGISQKLRDPEFVRIWKKDYARFLHPSTSFFDGSAKEIMQEFSPRYSSYRRNINICCAGVLAYLEQPEGASLRSELLEKLGGFIDLKGHHSGELAALFSVYNRRQYNKSPL